SPGEPKCTLAPSAPGRGRGAWLRGARRPATLGPSRLARFRGWGVGVSTKFVNIEDLRRAARRAMPKAMFDFVDGVANGEWTQRRNQAEFERIMFDPRVLVDVSRRDQSTTVFGQRIETPIIIAPTGLTAIAWPNAELLAARAARRAGAGF